MEEYIFNISGEEIQERLDAVPNKADKDSVYTKTETDAKLANKADKDNVYTKTETDTKLANKADKKDVYTKTETDTKLANKADKKDVYTKTETDTKLANKADKDSVYSKTETRAQFEEVDRMVANKADKASTLAGYGIGDAYTKRNVDALLAGKADTDVYKQIADVDADRRAAPFGKIIKEQIDTEEESYGGDIDELQICYSTVLSTFVYKEFGTTKYYANWPTKKHYTDANGYPYFGKQFYCHDENKMYVFDGMKLKAAQIPAVVAFSGLWDGDIDITMGSVADEDEFPEYEVVFSTVHNRFVYKTDDGKFYDNWSTRYLYIDQKNEYKGPRRDVMYFAHDLGNLYIYDYEVSGTLKLINEDLSDFLNKKDHALTEFITAGQEATVVDYANIFDNNIAEISKMHWMYFIRMKQAVVGFMDVQVSYAGNASKIRITERLRTRALLSNDKKSITWQPTSEWNEDHEYTRFILSYDDMSQGIRAGEWTAWYEVPKAGLMPAYVDGVFDVNRYVGSDTPYDSLSQVLNNAATLIPTTVRRGGMSIKFVQSSDNKYVRYRLTATAWSTTLTDWEQETSKDEFDNLLAKVDGAKLSLEQGAISGTTGEQSEANDRVRLVKFIQGYNKVVCNNGFKIVGVYEYTSSGTYIGRTILNLQEYEYQGVNYIKYVFSNTADTNITPNDNVLDYIFCDSILNKKIKALNVEVDDIKGKIVDAYFYKTIEPDIASGNRIVDSTTGSFSSTVNPNNYGNEITLTENILAIKVIGSPVFEGNYGYAFLNSNNQIVEGKKITTETYTIQDIQDIIQGGATKLRVSIKNTGTIQLYLSNGAEIILDETRKVDNKIDGLNITLEQGGYNRADGTPNSYTTRCRTPQALPVGKHEITCNSGYLIAVVTEYDTNNNFISGILLNADKYTYSGNNYVKYTFRNVSDTNISPSSDIIKGILYDSLLNQKIDKVDETLKPYPIIGSPEVYISESTNNVTLIDKVAPLYSFYDDLVTNYPDFFVRAADIGMDASNTYELRHYELRLSNPRIDNDRGGGGTNLWDFSQYKYRRILLVGGVHSEELCAMNALALAVRDILQSSDKFAHFIKSNFVIDIVPCENPWGLDNLDNVSEDHKSLNCNWVNLNRDYNSLTPQAETVAMKSLINDLITKGLVGIIDCHNTGPGQAYLVSNPDYSFYKYVAILTQQLDSMLFDEFKSVWGAGNHFHLWNTDGIGQIHWYGNTLGITTISCETANMNYAAMKITKDIVINTINAFGTTLRYKI